MNASATFKYTKENFFEGTEVAFKEVCWSVVPDRTPDFISDSGSRYYYIGDSVIRESNHWGIVATCDWNLKEGGFHNRGDLTAGIAKFSQFKKNTAEVNKWGNRM